MTSDVLSPEEMAQLLDCEVSTVDDKLRAGLLPGVKMGRSWVCPRSALMQALHDEAMKNLGAKKLSGQVVSINEPKTKRRTPPAIPQFKGGS